MKGKWLAWRDQGGTLHKAKIGGADEEHTHRWEDIEDAPEKTKLVQTGADGKLPDSVLPAKVVQTGADGKVPASVLPAKVVQTGADGKVPASVLPAKVVQTGAEGKVPASVLPATVVQTGADGKLPDSVLPAAVADKVELVTGTYEGNDSASMDVPLGFQPKAVLIVCMDGYMGTTNGYQYGGLCLPGLPLRSHGTGKTGHALAEITSTGFTVHKDNGSGSYLNSSQYMYYYIAFK